MADKKVSELDAITGADTAADDLFLIVDSSGAVSKKITRAELNNAIEQDVLENISITNLTSDLSTNGNDINFGDNDKAIFGAGSDLQIYHDGSNSYIQEGGTGQLVIRSEDLRLQDASGTNWLQADTDGAVRLYHNNAAKLATTSTGVDVTGTVTADGVESTCAAGDANQALLAYHPTSTSARTIAKFQSNVGGTQQDKVVIKCDGSVGIGTSSPSFSNGSGLEVANATTACVRIEGNSAAHAVEIYADSTGGTIDARGSGAALQFDLGGTEGMRITSGGAVGIGTSSPNANRNLHLFDSTSGALRIEGTARGGYVEITDGTNTQYIGTPHSIAGSGNSTDLSFWTAGSNRMTINSSGNVGIGGSETTVFNGTGGDMKLVVIGDDSTTTVANNSDAAIAIVNTNQTAGNLAGLHFARADTDDSPNYSGAAIVAQFPDAQVTGQYPKGRLHFNTSTSANTAPSTKMTIDESGRIGIGTVTPDSNLKIKSTGAATLRIDGGAVAPSVGPLIVGEHNDADAFYIGTNSVVLGESSNQDVVIYGADSSSGNIRFYAGASTETVRIRDGGGITFNGDTAAANALDDYEEGTFTPSYGQGVSSATYSVQAGRYTKVGNRVFFEFEIDGNSITGDSNTLYITGLPFTAHNAVPRSGATLSYTGGVAGSVQVTSIIFNNTNTMGVYKYNDGGSVAGNTLNLNGGWIWFGHYDI